MVNVETHPVASASNLADAVRKNVTIPGSSHPAGT
jgi:hypothetical protein